MSRDKTYGGLILLISLIVAIIYVAAFFAPWVSIYFAAWPSWLNWWAVAIPVFLFVLAALVICMWIGWTMMTTPPPAPLETEVTPPSTEESKKESEVN
ncbi:MAG: transcriptional regulator [Candidatus Bathyarchaeia archaeon]